MINSKNSQTNVDNTNVTHSLDIKPSIKQQEKIQKNQNKLNNLKNQASHIYKLLLEINNKIESNKSLNDENQTKALIKKQKRLYRNIHKKISSAQKMTSPDKFEKLPENIAISLQNVDKYYSSPTFALKVLEDVNLEIYKGDFVVILGPSGSGKTSLMNLLSGIDIPTFGSVNVEGFKLQNLSNRQLTVFRKDVIGYVFQRYGLLPNLTVFENVLMGSYLGKKTYSEKVFKQLHSEYEPISFSNAKEKCSKIIDSVGLTNQKEKYPYEMSGGQKQRTSIARTMAKNPLVIFGDEPTGAVDEEMSQTIIDAFVKINQDFNTTIIIITHDERISTFANRVIFVLDGKINNVVSKKKGAKL